MNVEDVMKGGVFINHENGMKIAVGFIADKQELFWKGSNQYWGANIYNIGLYVIANRNGSTWYSEVIYFSNLSNKQAEYIISSSHSLQYETHGLTVDEMHRLKSIDDGILIAEKQANRDVKIINVIVGKSKAEDINSLNLLSTYEKVYMTTQEFEDNYLKVA